MCCSYQLFQKQHCANLKTHIVHNVDFQICASRTWFCDFAPSICVQKCKISLFSKNATDRHRTSDRHTDLSRSRARLDPVSRHLKRCNRSKKPSKEGPESSPQIPLTSQLMGTSGFLGRWHSPQIAPATQKPSETSISSC